jgi:hypothetical protein
MVNNFKKMLEEREAMLPPELENRVSFHLGTMAGFGNVVELFVPNALQTVVRIIGGEDLPCLKRAARKINLKETEPIWRKRPEQDIDPKSDQV